jgi:serine protease Do
MQQLTIRLKPVIIFAMSLFLVGAWFVLTPMPGQAAVNMVPESFSTLAKEARPSVVNIRTEKTVKGGGRVFKHFFGPGGNRNPFEEFFGPFNEEPRGKEFKQRSLGSGFILDKEGYIVTNNHVVEDADKIKVRLSNEKEFDAEVVGRDPKTDLALIKINDADNLTPMPMGNSDKIEVGSWVVAIGSPFGFEQTVTAGIVSAKGRFLGSGEYDDFLQTDASINPGNSGGPLINMNGEVVGINTAIVASGQGIGFAIPINLAKNIVAQLKDGGEVTRGWLGVGIQNLTPELKDYYKIGDRDGVLVMQVFEGNPAAEAGIKAKDVITEVDGKPIADTRELSRSIADSPVGKDVTVTLFRDGKELKIPVTLAKRDDSVEPKTVGQEADEALGFKVSELTPEKARRFGFDEKETGVIVTWVDPEGNAGDAGLQPGDLVKEVDRNSIESLEDFENQVAEIKEGQAVQMLIMRPRVGFLVININP